MLVFFTNAPRLPTPCTTWLEWFRRQHRADGDIAALQGAKQERQMPVLRSQIQAEEGHILQGPKAPTSRPSCPNCRCGAVDEGMRRQGGRAGEMSTAVQRQRHGRRTFLDTFMNLLRMSRPCMPPWPCAASACAILDRMALRVVGSGAPARGACGACACGERGDAGEPAPGDPCLFAPNFFVSVSFRVSMG